jgi:prephenate dehydrogenase
MAKHLKSRFRILVSDTCDKSRVAERLGVEFVSLKETASKDVVIFSTPVSALKAALKKARPFFKKGALLVDVCSVKEKPAELMRKIPDVELLGTHPLFGPESGKSGIRGLKIVLCPIRIGKNRFARIKSFLKSIGLKTIVATPRNHDEQIVLQPITHFIARALKGISGQFTTKSSELLLGAVNLVKNDSDVLFKDMRTRFAARAMKKLLHNMGGKNV